MKKERSHVEDLRGATRLAVEATRAVTDLVQEMHVAIGGGPAILGKPLAGPVRAATNLVYGSIRGVTNLVGAGLDVALAQLAPLLGESAPGPEREAALAALGGVLGDYLAETHNPLAIEMSLRHAGRPLALEPDALRAAIPDATGALLVMVHGSCMNDSQWLRHGHDHGAALARDLAVTPIYVRYNSGRHVSTNGAELAALLERLTLAWPAPLERIAIVSHSMGGLVARSACRAAEDAKLGWRDALRALVFLGTPHHGAPLEKGGNWVGPLLRVSQASAPLARLAKIRSAGITDLRFGNVIDEHWRGRDRFELTGDLRSPVPLPEGVACYAIAGRKAGGGPLAALAGDGVVPVASALGVHARRPELTLAFPEDRKRTLEGALHLDLLDAPAVYETLRAWLSEA